GAVQAARGIARVDVEGPASNRPRRPLFLRLAHTCDTLPPGPLDVGDFLLPFGDALRELGDARLLFLLLLRRQERAVAVAHALERGLEAVVIALGDRVELVIVTAGAVHRQSEEGLANGADHLFQLFFADAQPHEHALLRLAHLVPRARDQEAGAEQG